MIRPEPLPYPDVPPRSFSDLPAVGEGSLARVGRRLAARVIDNLAISVPVFLAILGPHLVLGGTEDPGAGVPVEASIAVIVIPALYEFAMTALWGATLGKMALTTRIVAYADGSHPRPYQMGLRVLVPVAPSLLALAAVPALLGGVLGSMEFFVFATILFSPVLRGLHDLAAGTIVLRTE